ncbi:MAG: 4Fe-4S binding protein, partial [Anaerolineae bacterium]|nr:4Fe-4S binding protein [Anaerolineae bacterium]
MGAKVRIDPRLCRGCGECVSICPEGAIQLREGIAVVDETLCTGCEACVEACPFQAIYPVVEGEVVPYPENKPANSTVSRGLISRVERLMRSPALYAVAAFIGRELVPRALDAFLSRREGQVTKSSAGEV